jgi:hypothetical protein
MDIATNESATIIVLPSPYPGGDCMLSKNPASTEAITAAFGVLPQKNQSLSLTKHYKGITINEDVRVVDIKPDCATIQATQREIFPCLVGEIHLHSQGFPQSIAGQIHPVDYAQGTFLLSDLAYMDWKDRSFDRVQPKGSVYLNIHHNRETFRAFLEDISIDGMGILGNRVMDPSNQLRVGVKVKLEFQLDEEYNYANLAAMVVYRQKVGLQLVKFGLHLYPNAFQKRTLQRYISLRKDEILKEVHQTYIRSREPQRIENLFF